MLTVTSVWGMVVGLQNPDGYILFSSWLCITFLPHGRPRILLVFVGLEAWCLLWWRTRGGDAYIQEQNTHTNTKPSPSLPSLHRPSGVRWCFMFRVMMRRTRYVAIILIVAAVVVFSLWRPPHKNTLTPPADFEANQAKQGRQYTFNLFGGSLNIGNAMDRCSEISIGHNTTITDEGAIAFDVASFLTRFESELEEWQLAMATTVSEQITKDQWSHWERFGGLAVYLNDDVLVMALRVIYSKTGDRRQPQLSLVLVEAMDKAGNSLEEVNGIKYPYLLPVPFTVENDQCAGPEDPRVVKADDKVFVVFNMWSDGQRRMYLMPLSPDSQPVELRLPAAGNDSNRAEKNWTPFYDANHPNTLQFVYRWEHFQVVRCSLGSGECTLVTGSEADLSRPILAMRGGTPLIPVNGGWLGFARAHLLDCGCGWETYRPNLVAIAANNDGGYCLSDVSGYVDFDVAMTLWEGEGNVCDMKAMRPNAMVPTGLDLDGDGHLRLWYSVNDQDVAYLTLDKLFIGQISPQCRLEELHLYCALGESYQRCTDYFFKYGVGEYSEYH